MKVGMEEEGKQSWDTYNELRLIELELVVVS
jgi:hypothetical protein